MKLAQKVVLQYYRTKIKLYQKISVRKAAKAAFTLFCTPFFKFKGQIPDVFYKGKKIATNFDGFTVRGFEFGADSEKKVLIIHGWESTCYRFDKFIKTCTDLGMQVYCFDAIAHGVSSGKQLDVFLYARLIVHLHQKFGPFNHFMAHSLGGMALSVALSHFNINPSQDAKIVLFAPGGEAYHFFGTFYKTLHIAPSVQQGMNQLVKELSGFDIDWFSTKKHLSKLKNPVLWFHDNEDLLCPIKYAEEVAILKLPNITFYFSNGLGHSGIYRENKNMKIVSDFYAKDV